MPCAIDVDCGDRHTIVVMSIYLLHNFINEKIIIFSKKTMEMFLDLA